MAVYVGIEKSNETSGYRKESPEILHEKWNVEQVVVLVFAGEDEENTLATGALYISGMKSCGGVKFDLK